MLALRTVTYCTENEETPHPILPPPLNVEARERLRWRIVDLDKNPVEMNEDELRAWLLSIPDDELNELIALSDWTHPDDKAG